MKERFDYGEILFLGKCINKCYYCLGNEMPTAQIVSNLNTPYKQLNKLDEFVNRLVEANCDTIYLSSVVTEPLLYKDINSLTDYLTSKGFKVGIRTNGICKSFLRLIPKLESEISISINSLIPTVNEEICGNRVVPNISNIFKTLKENGKKCRISIVVNKYNFEEVPSIINSMQNYDCISYIQLRKRYKYDKKKDDAFEEDVKAFEYIKDWLDFMGHAKFAKSNFHESIIYDMPVPISLWEDVFKKESLTTLNYFSDGKITTHNLLVPSYEGK